MAKFTGRIDSALERNVVAKLTDEDAFRILEAGGTVLVQKFQDAVTERFITRSGSLHDSIQTKRGSDRSVIVTPVGTHPPNGRGIRKRKGKKRAKYNSEVGYVLENGSPRMENASFWMSETAEASEEAVVEAEAAAYAAMNGGTG